MEEEQAIQTPNTPYYNRGRLFYHIASYSLVGIILLSMLFGWLFNNTDFDPLRNVLIAALTLASYITVPIALYNIIKSIRTKEVANKYRIYYLIALLFFETCMLVLLAAIVMMMGAVC